MHIKGRTFIVSGGSSGLGFATTLLLLQQDANVAVLDLNPPSSSQVDASKTLFVKTDVASTQSIHDAVKATLKWTLETSKPLSGAICCAGIGSPALVLPKQDSSATHESVRYMDMRSFDRVLSINLRGTVDLVRLTVPHLALNEPWGVDGERGILIVVSSVAADEGQVGQLAYSASKGAVKSIVIPLARELGQKAGIRVMGIAPGLFETNMTGPMPKAGSSSSSSSATKSGSDKPKKSSQPRGMNTEMIQYPMRMGKAEEFAHLVKAIIENPMLNGSCIRLDGAVRMPTRL